MATPLPLTNQVSQGSKKQVTFRTKFVQYGNGYSQAAPDGINDKDEVWNLSFNNLNTADANTLRTFLDTVKGCKPVSWNNKIYLVDSKVGYDEDQQSGNLFTFTFTLKQVFGYQ